MTSTRYLIARLSMALGLDLRQRRMAEAASETHLLREAEQVLGLQLWQDVEEIEEVGVEYWKLRQLNAQRKKLQAQLEAAETQLTDAHKLQADAVTATSNQASGLDEERAKLLSKLEDLSNDQTKLVEQARQLRRRYDGLKTKLKVLESENASDSSAANEARQRLQELRKQFERLKEQRDTTASTIQTLNAKLDELDSSLDSKREEDRAGASGTYQQISGANQQISSLRAEIGMLEQEMKQLCSDIGRYVSRNVKSCPHCLKASKPHKALVEVMEALRLSITLNHRLANRT